MLEFSNSEFLSPNFESESRVVKNLSPISSPRLSRFEFEKDSESESEH